MDILRSLLLCLEGGIIGIGIFIFLTLHPEIDGNARVKVFVFGTMLCMAIGMLIDRIFQKHTDKREAF